MSVDRKRSLDVNKLTLEQVDQISVQIGQKIAQITDEAVNKVNALLAVYGMSAKMAIVFDTLDNKKEGENAQEQS